MHLFHGLINSYGVFTACSHVPQTTVRGVADSSLTPLLEDIADISVDSEVSLAQLTTLHVGAQPRLTVRCTTPQAVVDTVTRLDAAGVPLLILGGGSNLLVADDEPLDLVVVRIECAEVSLDPHSGVLRAQAGAVWDDVVDTAVAAGLGGIECLSGIPGSAGATPVQNVGAYGVEIADVLLRVELLDRATGQVSWVPASDLDLAYRYSNLKFTSRGVVLAIELQLTPDGLSAPLRFGELARRLEAQGPGERRPVAAVRQAVLELRQAKGMVLIPGDHDTWSAGSFFTNPVVDPQRASDIQDKVRRLRGDEDAERMPQFPAGENQLKLSAAWLIDRAGFAKGYPGEGAPARLSTRHTLALTNRGSARTADIVALARTIRDGVKTEFGVVLEPEPIWLGVHI
ncbi:UDP-N-acetylmuramate dehydrogenase [Corynebacterium sp. 3HC-13]|nr:UDP-N-acetylmuramate dehydrogenase [Corynebacterium poyangense]